MSPMSSFKHIFCISNELPSMHTFPRTLCIMDSKAKDFHFFRFVFVLLYSLYCLVGNCPVAHLFKHIVCISNELPSMHTFPRTLCIMDSKAKDFHFFRFVFVLLYSLYCLVGNCPVAHLFLYFRTGCTNLLTCTPCTFIPLYPCTLHSTLWVRVGWVYWVKSTGTFFTLILSQAAIAQLLIWRYYMELVPLSSKIFLGKPILYCLWRCWTK